MSSSKDTFEAKTFASHTFGAGTWRGGGVDIELPEVTVEVFVTSSVSSQHHLTGAMASTHTVTTAENTAVGRMGT